jgi:hypothetical protein
MALKAPRVAKLTNLSTALVIGLALAWASILASMFYTHAWILDGHGKPIVTDFLEVWVAGKTVLTGHASAAYDPELHYAAEVAAAGHGFHGHLWWHYPPLVLFLAAGLALLPYATAFFLWVTSTSITYGVVIWKIARSRTAAFAALGAPAVFLNAVSGQNGCLTALLMGGGLLWLEAQPILAGIFIGLLTYKPQLGLLFPFALAAAGRWRCFTAATVVALLGVIAPALVYGAESLRAFLHFLPIASRTMLVDNPTGWSKQQSIYALARFENLPNSVAWSLQLAAIFVCVLALAWLWRRDVSYALKAAALVAASFFATPYLYMYDFPALSVAIAFLYRHRRFDALELAGIWSANLIVAAYAFGVCVAPIGPLAVASIGGLIGRRLWTAPLKAGASPPANEKIEAPQHDCKELPAHG